MIKLTKEKFIIPYVVIYILLDLFFCFDVNVFTYLFSKLPIFLFAFLLFYEIIIAVILLYLIVHWVHLVLYKYNTYRHKSSLILMQAYNYYVFKIKCSFTILGYIF